MCILSAEQGSHASWKVLDFLLKTFQDHEVLENHFGPGKMSLKVMHFSGGSNGKQAAIVLHPVCVEYCFLNFLQ